MTEETATLPDEQPILRVVAMLWDANPGGSIFGGWIMSQVDIAGSIPALKFHHPVFVGDLVSCYAEITKVGRTSITVEGEVYAQRNLNNLETIKVTQAELTYVALDENRKPRAISPKLDGEAI